jgi:aminopeptidase YwaD
MTPEADLPLPAGSGPGVWHYLSHLAGTIGERPTGSDGNLLSQAFIGDHLARNGYATDLLGFHIPSWTVRGTQCSCAGRPVPVVANPYSPSCSVTAPIAAIGTTSELAAADLSGKVAVVHGDLASEPLMPRNFPFYTHAAHQEIARLLVEKSPAAIITVSPREDQAVPVIIDGDFPVPSCTVTAGEGAFLLSQAKSPVILSLDTKVRTARAADVIGRSPGTGHKKIVICAHFDTKYGTPGALDNASGVAALMVLARALRDRPLKSPLELVFMNGEECYAAPGEVAYLRAGGCDPAAVACCINIDGIGLAGLSPGISYYNCPAELEAACEEARAGDPGMVRADPWPQGDHMMFAAAGIPCVAFSTSATLEVVSEVIHTEKDRLECLDREVLGRTVETVEKVVRALDRVPGPT